MRIYSDGGLYRPQIYEQRAIGLVNYKCKMLWRGSENSFTVARIFLYMWLDVIA